MKIKSIIFLTTLDYLSIENVPNLENSTRKRKKEKVLGRYMPT